MGAPRVMTYAQADTDDVGVSRPIRSADGSSLAQLIGIQLPVPQHRRRHSDHPRRSARRHDRGPAPAAVAPRRSLIAALSRVGAKVLVTCGRVGTFDYGGLVMDVAAEIFPVRYVRFR